MGIKIGIEFGMNFNAVWKFEIGIIFKGELKFDKIK